MSLVQLPTELLDVIFEPLPKNTLAALSTTSSFIGPCAIRQLYRHLSLSSYANNLHAVSTLASNPDLSSLVRSFFISLDDSDVVSQDYYATLAKALQNMSDLTSLQLHIDTHASWVLQNTTPNASPIIYSRLQDFATSFEFDTHLAAFLVRTPALLSLQLPSSCSPSDTASLPTTAIPCLASYTGPTSLLGQIIPSRPITSLHLSGDLALQDIELLARASRAPTSSVRDAAVGSVCQPVKVEVLSAITSVAPVQALEALAQACPHLVCLRVMTTCAFWEAPDLVSSSIFIFFVFSSHVHLFLSFSLPRAAVTNLQTFYTRIANTLSTLRSLSAFELSGMHWESRPKSSPSSEDGSSSEKEWVSPPVTPRVAEVGIETQEQDLEFDETFLEWAY